MLIIYPFLFKYTLPSILLLAILLTFIKITPRVIPLNKSTFRLIY